MSETTGRFAGKQAIVTGGARGIGLGCVHRLAAEGARVLMVDLLEDEGRAATDGLKAAGFDVRFRRADAGDVHDIAAVVDEAAAIGAIDILVCAAGIGASATTFLELSIEDYDRVQRVNLRGPLLLAQGVARKMLAERRAGVIVFVSSVAAVLASPEQSAYCISKAGLGMLVKLMGVELASHGIRVNAVAPGPVRTEMAERHAATPGAREAMLLRTPIGRMAEIAEIAGTVAFLASDDAGFFAGQSLYADGGRLALNHTVSIA